MKTLLKLAIGGALAGALVHMLMKQRSGDVEDMEAGGFEEDLAVEMVADTNMVSSGDPELRQREPQPQDWRGAQNVLDS